MATQTPGKWLHKCFLSCRFRFCSFLNKGCNDMVRTVLIMPGHKSHYLWKHPRNRAFHRGHIQCLRNEHHLPLPENGHAVSQGCRIIHGIRWTHYIYRSGAHANSLSCITTKLIFRLSSPSGYFAYSLTRGVTLDHSALPWLLRELVAPHISRMRHSYPTHFVILAIRISGWFRRSYPSVQPLTLSSLAPWYIGWLISGNTS